MFARYPWPRYTLELADELGLNPDQRGRVQALFASMKVESIEIGSRLIAEEAAIDEQFAHKTLIIATLTTLVEAIGKPHAALRATPLRNHLLTLDVLTLLQTQRYSELRGYASSSAHNPGRPPPQPQNK